MQGMFTRTITQQQVSAGGAGEVIDRACDSLRNQLQILLPNLDAGSAVVITVAPRQLTDSAGSPLHTRSGS